MVNLDALALKMELTPEAAIGIVQKEVNRKGWKKFDLSDILTVYTPFYIFSFDVIAEGGAPPGKAALNANTGEINEFVPSLLERPIQKLRKTAEGIEAEIEPTNIKESEVEKVASVKIANMLGAKRENIVISAISKIYIPMFRLWLDVAGDSFKVEIDAALGYPTGLELIPKREKTWDESTSETIRKMQSPSGIAQLASATSGEIAKVAGGKADNKYIQWAIIGAVILVIGYFALQSLNSKTDCTVDNEFLSKPEYLGLFGNRKLSPQEADADTLYVTGSCKFSGDNDKLVIVSVGVKQNGLPLSATTVQAVTRADSEITRQFNVNWTRTDEELTGSYELTVDKLIG